MAKIALITGASRGIGAACAREFYRNGVTVAVGYREREQEAKALAAALPGCIAVRGDVADSKQVNDMVEAVLDRFGQIDILVNNAGVAGHGLLTDLTDEAWARLIGVNLSGAFYCCRAVLPGMIKRGTGSIVNLSSIWGVNGGSCEAAYSAAKAGIIGLTKALAKEVGSSGIRVNCVAPGVIDTDMNAMLDDESIAALTEQTPLGRMGRAAEVARAVWYLASDEAGFVTGQVLGVNGGMAM